jgi:hypothetical protein
MTPTSLPGAITSGVFNTGLTFWQFIAMFVLAVLSIIAIRISFDINKFLERRDKNNIIKLKNACPHFMLVFLVDREFEVRSLYYKPAGTFNYFCRQCGLETALDFEQHERQANLYVKDPEKLVKDQEKFTKLAKKAGKVSK